MDSARTKGEKMGPRQDAQVFVALVNDTQTSKVYQWDRQSLERAIQWAVHIEEQTERCIANEWTLPLSVNRRLTAEDLENARVHLLAALIQSPFLATHPKRSELLILALQELKKLELPSTTSSVPPHIAFASKLLAGKATNERKTATMLQFATSLRDNCKYIQVQVLDDIAFSIPAKESFTLDPKTIQLESIVTTLEHDLQAATSQARKDLVAQAIDPLESNDTVTDTQQVPLLLLLRLPSLSTKVKNDIRPSLVDSIERWLSRNPSTLMKLPPWFSAMVVNVLPAQSPVYIRLLTRHCQLPIDISTKLAERIGSLLVQNADTQAQLQAALGALDRSHLVRLLKI